MNYQKTQLTYEEMIDLVAKLELIAEDEIDVRLPIDRTAFYAGNPSYDEQSADMAVAKGRLIASGLARSLQYAIELGWQIPRVAVKDRKLELTEREVYVDATVKPDR